MNNKPLILILSDHPGIDNDSTWYNKFALTLNHNVPSVDWCASEQLWVTCTNESILLTQPWTHLYDTKIRILHVDFRRTQISSGNEDRQFDVMFGGLERYLNTSNIKAMVITGLTQEEAQGLPMTLTIRAEPTLEVFEGGAIWQSIKIHYPLNTML